MAEKKKIFVLSATGFIIRNLLLGKFKDEITKNNKLIAAVPDPEDKSLLKIVGDRDVKLVPFKKENINLVGRKAKYTSLSNYFYLFNKKKKENDFFRYYCFFF